MRDFKSDSLRERKALPPEGFAKVAPGSFEQRVSFGDDGGVASPLMKRICSGDTNYYAVCCTTTCPDGFCGTRCCTYIWGDGEYCD